MIATRVRAPEFPSNKIWLNTDRPLLLKELKGRIVLLDFWTYCCINCLHVLPELKSLEHKYRDSLTVIGVHSAKFDNEKEVENIRQAILRYDIEHPVVVDSNFDIWQHYAVRAWPTLMVIDPEGYVIGQTSGEGNRDVLDELIEKMIREHQEKGTINFQEIRLTLERQQRPLITPLAFPGKVLARSDRLSIADSGHHRLIVSNFQGKVSQIIGTGEAGLTDGSFAEAQFKAPQGMAYDAEAQLLYVADTENHAIRQVDFLRQQVKTIAGTGQQSHQIRPHGGQGLETLLNSPWDLIKIGDYLYIAMAGPHQIWGMDLTTGEVKTYAGTGREFCIDGPLAESAFAQPSGITTDNKELLVADSEISSIRGVGLGKEATVRTICGSGELFGFGDKDGTGLDVRLQHCLGVEYDRGSLWVADTYNHKIKRVDIRTGECQTVLGSGMPNHQDGKGTAAALFEPSGLSSDNSQLYIADTNNHAIRRLDLTTFEVTTLKFPGLCAPNVCFPSEKN